MVRARESIHLCRRDEVCLARKLGASSERELPGRRHDLSPRAQEARPPPTLSASLLLARPKSDAVGHRASSRVERDLKGVLDCVLVCVVSR